MQQDPLTESQGARNDPPEALEQHRGPHGALERGHWKTAVFGWLAFVVAALAIGMQVGTKQIDQQNSNVGEAHRADQILRDAGFKPPRRPSSS